MPALAMRSGLRAISSRPSKTMEPLRWAIRPMMARIVLVLPAPLRPSSVTTSPAGTSKLMPCRMWLSPYQPCTSRTASCDSGMVLLLGHALAGAHVGLDHLRVLRHLGIGALRQHFAACQYCDGVGQ